MQQGGYDVTRKTFEIDPFFAEYTNARSGFLILNLALKRVFDFIGALVALACFAPLFIVVAIAIKLDSPGPVLFKQKRLGLYGKEYTMFKFRTMCQNAEQMKGGLFTFAGDPRVTRVGSWLRKTSIDELPQLVNVLLGDMSLVGPRPPVTYELGDFGSLNRRYKRRFVMKPGITGLSQVSGRNTITWDQKVQLDNEYIQKFHVHGVVLDFVILLRTVKCVLERSGVEEEKIYTSLDDESAAEMARLDTIRRAHQLEEEDLLFLNGANTSGGCLPDTEERR